jgi:hypothetical protein
VCATPGVDLGLDAATLEGLWMQILEYMQIGVIDKHNQCMFSDSSICALEIIQISGDLCRELDFNWGCSLLLWSFACYLS